MNEFPTKCWKKNKLIILFGTQSKRYLGQKLTVMASDLDCRRYRWFGYGWRPKGYGNTIALITRMIVLGWGSIELHSIQCKYYEDEDKKFC